MTARISKEFSFNAAIHFENMFIINNYEVNLFMDVNTEDMEEQTIALERLKYLFEECFENGLFIHLHQEKQIIENYLKAGLKLITLPDEPYDQVVASVIMKKVDSILEEKMFVEEISILSKICEGVEFHIGSDEDLDLLHTKDAWWFSPLPVVNDLAKKSKDKVVKLKKDAIDWSTLCLNWSSDTKKNKNQDVVILNLDK